MPLQATSGAASYDAFGGGVPVVPNYIEEVFSTWLRISDGTNTQTVVNGINLSVNGGLVWSKPRAVAGENHILVDSARGVNKYLSSDLTSAQGTMTYPYTFNTNGYTVGNGNFWANGVSLVDWTFRKQPKFFDVVTYTGDGTNGRTVAHSLGSVPGCMIVKRTDASNGWAVYHRSMNASPQDYMMRLNATDAAFTTSPSRWNNTLPTATEFTLSGNDEVNGSGATYVAYLFAHNAGGFGLTGTDNVISCGSYTGNGSATGPEVNIGYEPQWLLIKEATQSGNAWSLFDNMRGLSVAGPSGHLRPNASDAEDTTSVDVRPTATGFQPISSSGRVNRSGETFIYIAIRRGPMKVPTSGTSVFSPNAYTGGTAGTSFNLGFVPDTLLTMRRDTSNFNILQSRLTGLQYMLTHATDAEAAGVTGTPQWDANTGTIKLATATSVTGWNASGFTYVNEVFARAPNFFDEVCYTGTGSNTTQTHNLTVAPELVIIKSRSNAIVWVVGNTAIGFGNYLLLNATDASASGSNVFNSTAPTSTVFSIGSGSGTNQSGATYVAYLFATLAGVSKVGSYTGNGSSQTINCGFTGGARFVLVKATSTTGNWIVADSARGIVAGNDPALYLNSTAAEVTGLDWIDADNSGFVVNETATIAANTNGVSYIFLAIA